MFSSELISIYSRVCIFSLNSSTEQSSSFCMPRSCLPSLCVCVLWFMCLSSLRYLGYISYFPAHTHKRDRGKSFSCVDDEMCNGFLDFTYYTHTHRDRHREKIQKLEILICFLDPKTHIIYYSLLGKAQERSTFQVL
jgi:hypothetical protein